MSVNLFLFQKINFLTIQVCSTANKTYDSDCHFLREKCWCSRNDFKCREQSVVDEKLDYYGECKRMSILIKFTRLRFV